MRTLTLKLEDEATREIVTATITTTQIRDMREIHGISAIDAMFNQMNDEMDSKGKNQIDPLEFTEV